VHDLTDNQSQLLDALRRTGGATSRQLAETTGLAYSTVTRLLRELAALGLAGKQHTPPDGPAGPSRPDTSKNPTLWHPAEAPRDPAPAEPEDAGVPEPAAGQDAADEAATAPTGTDTAPPVPLGKGELRRQVLAVLRDHPDEELGPTQIAKHLPGRSAGAIANACDRLTAIGLAHLTSDKPRRYAATADASGSPLPRRTTA
jgi:hypothetical protein